MNKTIENISLVEEKKRIAALLPPEMTNYYSNDDTIVELTYPSLSIPQKVTSIDLEKQPTIVGTLNGIKGQYLIFDDGKVINIRKYGGYLVEVKN
jgi:hypothetical protein